MPKNHLKRIALGLGATLLSATLLSTPAHAEDPLRIGMSTALTGPAKALGLGMRTGVNAAFAEQNAKGGVQGRTLELVPLDDGYEPSRTAPNMRKLIDEKKVYTVLGNVGTPTAAVAVPIANEKEVPIWGSFTGAGLLRKAPPDRYVVNYRASYAQEMALLIGSLLEQTDVKPEEIAFFTQNDAYGDAGHSGGMAALKERGYARAERLLHARYTRNTSDVEYAVSQLIDPRNQPRVVFMVGTAPPCAKMVRIAKEYFLDATFVAVSFVGAGPLMSRLGPKIADGIVVSQVVPHPEASDLPAAVAFRKALPNRADRGFVSFEGYLAARFFIEAANRAKLGSGPGAVIDAIEAGEPFDLGLGIPRKLSKENHQLESRVWPTVIRGDDVIPMDTWKSVIGGSK